ncbi:MAG: NAD-binding protein, partial [Delftia acidovorans]|nr:NAD-binding protein [Delftia acidovorans]
MPIATNPRILRKDDDMTALTLETALPQALEEAGIIEADAFVAATNGDNTNIVISQIAQRR